MSGKVEVSDISNAFFNNALNSSFKLLNKTKVSKLDDSYLIARRLSVLGFEFYRVETKVPLDYFDAELKRLLNDYNYSKIEWDSVHNDGWSFR